MSSEDSAEPMADDLSRTIAALRASEARLEDQRLLYEAILSNTPDLAYVWNLDHRFIYANEGLLRMWGKSMDEAIGKNCLELGYEPWHAAMHDREIEQVIATREPVRGDVPFTGTFGRRIYDYILVPVIGANGDVIAVAGTTRDVTDYREFEQRQGLLIDELNHRVKNTLSIVQALAMQSFGSDPANRSMRAAFQGRLEALAGAHNILTRESWKSAELRDIVTASVDACGVGDRIEIDGPEIHFDPRTAVTVAMAMHELCTNAIKYGALSNADGHVDLRWSTDGDRFHLRWEERDGPQVVKPERRGFGSRMLERALAGELHGKVTVDYQPNGLVCEVDAPIPQEAPDAGR